MATTKSLLFIDGSKTQRTYWVDQLKRCSPDYEIVEASDGQSGLYLYRSLRIDCVVLDFGLPDQAGFRTLVELVPIASRPQVAVIVLTQMSHRGISEIATDNGAYTCLVKRHTTGEDLDRAIQRAMTLVGQMNHSRQSTNTLTTSA
jgi:DNA-binding NarL/FixJ family response regulator